MGIWQVHAAVPGATWNFGPAMRWPAESQEGRPGPRSLAAIGELAAWLYDRLAAAAQ